MIGLRLRQIRQEYKISCKQFGKDIELSASALSHYETGISVPSIRITLRIAEYFHVSIDYLLGRSEFRNQEEVGERVKKKVEKQYINTLIDRDMMAKMKKIRVQEVLQKCRVQKQFQILAAAKARFMQI